MHARDYPHSRLQVLEQAMKLVKAPKDGDRLRISIRVGGRGKATKLVEFLGVKLDSSTRKLARSAAEILHHMFSPDLAEYQFETRLSLAGYKKEENTGPGHFVYEKLLEAMPWTADDPGWETKETKLFVNPSTGRVSKRHRGNANVVALADHLREQNKGGRLEKLFRSSDVFRRIYEEGRHFACVAIQLHWGRPKATSKVEALKATKFRSGGADTPISIELTEHGAGKRRHILTPKNNRGKEAFSFEQDSGSAFVLCGPNAIPQGADFDRSYHFGAHVLIKLRCLFKDEDERKLCESQMEDLFSDNDAGLLLDEFRTHKPTFAESILDAEKDEEPGVSTPPLLNIFNQDKHLRGFRNGVRTCFDLAQTLHKGRGRPATNCFKDFESIVDYNGLYDVDRLPDDLKKLHPKNWTEELRTKYWLGDATMKDLVALAEKEEATIRSNRELRADTSSLFPEAEKKRAPADPSAPAAPSAHTGEVKEVHLLAHIAPPHN